MIIIINIGVVIIKNRIHSINKLIKQNTLDKSKKNTISEKVLKIMQVLKVYS